MLNFRGLTVGLLVYSASIPCFAAGTIERRRSVVDGEYIVRITTSDLTQQMFALCDDGDKVLSGGCNGGKNVIVSRSSAAVQGSAWVCGFRYFEEAQGNSEKILSIETTLNERAEKDLTTVSMVKCEKSTVQIK